MEAEVLALQRKVGSRAGNNPSRSLEFNDHCPQIRLLEDRRDGLADRLALTSSQLAGAHTSLQAADGGREAMVLCMFKSQFSLDPPRNT